jgi:photosystem II stability/assembly factor-like uncharacterized protein
VPALRFAGLTGVTLLTLLAACDKDPNVAPLVFQVTCPTGTLDVNAPILLNFSQAVNSSSVSLASIVVTDSTGLPVPGSVNLSNGTTVQFVPSAPLPFGAHLRLRVQNVLAENDNTPLPLTVCALTTQAPSLQPAWSVLPQPTGASLLGASLITVDTGYVASSLVPIFRGTATGFDPVFNLPYYSQAFDVSFATTQHGFASHFNTRTLRGVINETLNGGQTWDTLFSTGTTIQRLFTNRIKAASDTLFLVAGGGRSNLAVFHKYTPAARSFASTQFTGTGAVADIDFAATDTVNGVAATNGAVAANTVGRVFTSANGGATWAELAGFGAPTRVVTYFGAARRASGDLFITGGNGYAIRIHPSGAVDTLVKGAVSSIDSTRFAALIYTDVEFAPDNDQKGWLIGARQTGVVNGVPKFEGLIFQTTDGGGTWVRQGVRGAPNVGETFPRLNRISIFDQNHVWIVGDGGTVLQYQP